MDAQVQDPADQAAARTHPPSMVDPVPMAGRVVMVEQATQAIEVAVVLLLLEAHQHPSVAEVDEVAANQESMDQAATPDDDAPLQGRSQLQADAPVQVRTA